MGVVWSVLKNKLRRFAKRRLPSIGASLLIVALSAFTLYNCLDIRGVEVETTPAVKSVEYEIARLKGYIFRDENVLYSKNSGAAVYRVNDGERVSVGTELARVYTFGSTEEYLKKRRAIEEKIAVLEASIRTGRLNSQNADETKRLSSGVYSEIMAAIARGDYSAAAALERDFTVGLNAYALLTGKNQSLSDELESARGELNALTNSYLGAYESISTDTAGYFCYGSDGLERVFDYAKISTLTPESLAQMITTEPYQSGADGQFAVGRMIFDYVWYLAVPADAETCRKVEQKDSGVSVTFSRSGTVLEMKLERVAYSTDGSEGVMVLSSGMIPQDFDFSRVQQVDVLVGELSGYRVPESAVRELRGLPGVYVLSSSRAVFRRINIIYKGDGYVVAAFRDTDAENYKEFLDLNDNIIISVSDGELYDGRVFD